MYATFSPPGPVNVTAHVFDDMGHLDYKITGTPEGPLHDKLVQFVTSLNGTYYQRTWLKDRNGEYPLYKRLHGVPKETEHDIDTVGQKAHMRLILDMSE